MDLLEAVARLHSLPADERPDLFPEPVTLVGQEGQTADIWAEYATGLVSLSGQLEDAATDADLADAVRHGAALLNAESSARPTRSKPAYVCCKRSRAWAMAWSWRAGSEA